MSVSRVHFLISDESLNQGRRLARQKGVSISKIVEGLLLTSRRQLATGKTFSQRWGGKIRVRPFSKSDRRAEFLAKKYL